MSTNYYTVVEWTIEVKWANNQFPLMRNYSYEKLKKILENPLVPKVEEVWSWDVAR